MGPEALAPGANAGYMYAAYLVTGLILAGYAVALWRRSRRGSGPGS